MSQDNPFSDEKTVIRPNPAGRRTGAAAPPAGGPMPPPFPAAPPAGGPFGPAPSAPFGAAVPGAQMPSMPGPFGGAPGRADVEGLRERIAREIRIFQQRATSAGVQPEALAAGHYAVCATVDDIVSNTPWGASTWARQSMTGAFHNDVSGGERFFEFLGHLHKEPGRFGDVLELMYLCLSLGFEGRLRVIARGATELARIREGIYGTLRQLRGEFERELSPHWRGVEAPHRVLTSFLPGWVVGVAAAAAIVLTFIGYTTLLNNDSDDVYARMTTLPPSGKVALRAQVPAPPPVPRDGTLDRLRAFLAPEIKEGLVTLVETNRTATIRLTSQNMFDSGSANLRETMLPLMNRIAAALNTEPGAVLVVGHTDNVPIRSVRFPSNFHLSTARAEAVRDILKKTINDRARLGAEGRADSEPLVPNDTPEHRAANRRIEIVLTKQEPAAR
jgi:type VI secretion system protein ImpK